MAKREERQLQYGMAGNISVSLRDEPRLCALKLKKQMEMQRMNRKLRDKLILVATCLMMLCSIPSFGQVLKGSISGTAVDQNGAVVPGAQVKATGTGTGSVLTTTTDNSGLFRFSLIPAGEYKVQITAQNFKTTDTTVVVTSG